MTNAREKIVFDFSNRDATLNAMSKYFSISKYNIEKYLNRSKDYNVIDFIEKFNINLMELDTDKAFIRNTHITTLFDGYEDLIKYGFIDLQKALTYDTNLKNFLKDNNIYFDIENQIIVIDDINYDLKSDSKCKSFTLYLKIHDRNGEREAFITGTDHGYSCVNKYPEIIDDIEKFCDYIGASKNLTEKWEKIHNGKYCVIEFDVNVNYIKYEYDHYFCDYDYLVDLGCFDEESIPENYKKNRFILSYCIDVVNNGLSKGRASIIDNRAIIKFTDLKINEFYNKI